MARGYKGSVDLTGWMGKPCIGWEAWKRVMIAGKDKEFIRGHDMPPNCSPTLYPRPPYVFPGLEQYKGQTLLVIVRKCC